MFASVLSRCCICLQWFSSVFRHFPQVFQMLISCVSSAFKLMLQMLHLDVSKVDRTLHLPPRFLLPHLGVSSSTRRQLGIRRPLSLFLDAGDIRDVGPVWTRETARKTAASIGVRALASPIFYTNVVKRTGPFHIRACSGRIYIPSISSYQLFVS